MRLSPSLQAGLSISVLSLLFAVSAAAQSASDPTEGVNSGNYNIRQTIELGYRNTDFSGNAANYNTFVNLNSGFRLFEESMNMHSLNHAGFLFDTLSLYNFGYGGDPNNLSRLRAGKNKWYDFRGSFRRNKNPWNYNLLANCNAPC